MSETETRLSQNAFDSEMRLRLFKKWSGDKTDLENYNAKNLNGRTIPAHNYVLPLLQQP